MEQGLKQRLVGAVVITSLAAIFVPMLFDDPIDETAKIVSELKIPDMPVAVVSPQATSPKTPPKSVDDVIKLPEPEIIKQQIARQKTIADKIRWFIQLGTFEQKSNAIALKNKISKKGFPVAITSVRTDKGQFYRVKVGPELNRKRAEKMIVKLEKFFKIKGIVAPEGK
ncbi:MAG: SPOR domain-containing protein [Methylococcales bacterium]|nr:SPOR domain-containing protein [Methylococcales bacterium]